MIITTGEAEAPDIVERAKRLAQETGCRYVPRGGQSLRKLARRMGEEDVLVVLHDHVRLSGPDGSVTEFHPSMGFVRLKRVLRGKPDPMLEASRMEEGDSVLDCTAGLGADALVFSGKGGPNSRVVALESSLPLFAMLKEGLRTYKSQFEKSDEAMRRIIVKHGHHLEYLRSLPDRSVDIVYFDPMFREPITSSDSMNPLRLYANGEPLDEESVRQAVRVARKTVVMKETRYSGEFERLGFTVMPRGQSKTTYGVISIDS
ncbi:class I SAM-dependent methyltransferase [Paenibacillus ihbetae]|uniref:SAM-dependent methyltransferase n=1 Tax=Paenibacillus ihbetae TaxID=1870820 RepID=A0A1B2DVG4_9BACL|nr:class I SAM-dependent methyltransferase [Paenibacillus ihbetae]ANY71709.1 SAM-dependent methyltransferase [Paenibacillus ihbetae]OOC60987.1 SAM-dependent methyltransferase [Paenibacillus ihbetae]